MFSIVKLATLVAVLGASLSSVSAHGLITSVTGANGKTGTGFAVVASTPRTGTTAKPFQQDTPVFSAKAGVCGKTAAGGNTNVAAQLAAAVALGLPTAAADGTVTMTLHQVNGDGAGPYSCEVSANGTGNDFKAATVTKNVPGVNGNSNAKATDFPLVAKLPAGTACKGGPQGNACLVRCKNTSGGGPFGGCVAVTTAAAAKGKGAVKRNLLSRFVGAELAGQWI